MYGSIYYLFIYLSITCVCKYVCIHIFIIYHVYNVSIIYEINMYVYRYVSMCVSIMYHLCMHVVCTYNLSICQ